MRGLLQSGPVPVAHARVERGLPLYGPDGPPCFIPLMRMTSANVDAAGNVWTCNNWKPDFTTDAFGEPLQDESANPGGDGVVIFVGLAAPRVR